MKIGRFLPIYCAILVSFALAANRAGAVTYDLDTILDHKLTSSSSSFGTISFTDNSENPYAVHITIHLTIPSWKILSYDFNFDDDKFSSVSWFVLTDWTRLSVLEDRQKAGGYGGKFDIEVPKRGNIGEYGDYSATLMLITKHGYYDLNASDFDFKDTCGNLFAAVHIGNYYDGKCDDSIWVGSQTPVPEPATLFLFGGGLIGLAVYFRRCKT